MKIRGLLSLVIVPSMLGVPAAYGLDLPPAAFANLNSENFRTRETAQAELLVWARERRLEAMDEFFAQSRAAADPEIRERCMAILRELVLDDYLKEGEGYIGIRMRDEFANVPDDARARGVVRVIEVVPDSAAQKAGLEMNDLIASLDGHVWHEEPASLAFGDKIRQMKPGTKVKLKVLREGKLLDIEVSLGRRPLIADTPFFDDRQIDIEALEKTSKDAYFRKWLERKKAGN